MLKHELDFMRKRVTLTEKAVYDDNKERHSVCKRKAYVSSIAADVTEG